MFRIATLVVASVVTNTVFADDTFTLSLGDRSSYVDGQEIRYDLYYVLVSKDNSFVQGKLFQVSQLKTDRSRYSIQPATFLWPAKDDSLTIRWGSGAVERATVTPLNTETGRLRYRIYDHTDKKQIGDSYVAKVQEFESLPTILQTAVRSSLSDESAAGRSRARALQADRERRAAQLRYEMQMGMIEYYDNVNRMYSRALGFPTFD